MPKLKPDTIFAVFLLLLSSIAMSASEYVGSGACKACHAAEYQHWKGSHHDLAMQEANEKTVLGDFKNRSFNYFGVKSRFYKQDGGYFVETDNTRGELESFRVSYTFGFYPLQQYLIAFPNGRYQALSIAWDSRPKEEGGQRWFHLYPNEEIKANDSLHWTGSYMNWNSNCADCHSTNLQKHYDADANSYKTTWSEINVSCESCHGPAQQHLEWVKQKTATDKQGKAFKNSGFARSLATSGHWQFSDGKSTAGFTGKVNEQIDVCGGCHSRRSVIDKDISSGSYHDNYLITLPKKPLYHGDGQILEEDYVLGSFLQSKMFHQGVVCSNCHEPHSLQLRAPGNAVCTQCHKATVFDQAKHHRHSEGSTGAQCVNCHMPETTYMVVDPRRDHSLRIPRPDLTVAHGSPNACNQCHKDKTPEWADKALDGWLKAENKTIKPHYGEQLLIGQSNQNEAETALMLLAIEGAQPAIIRSAALSQLRNTSQPQAILVAQRNLYDDKPLVRRGAVEALESVPLEQKLQWLLPLIEDPVKSVRFQVARQLASIELNSLATQEKLKLEELFNEYLQSLQVQADIPNVQVNLGFFYTERGDLKAAEKAYLQAILLDKYNIGARLNLADLYRQKNADQQGEKILQETLLLSPNNAAVFHALGLLYVRQKQYDQALEFLENAVSFTPDNTRYNYVYAVALNSQGRAAKALDVLITANKRQPNHAGILQLILQLASQQRRWEEALIYAEQLQQLQPDNQRLKQLIAQLKNKKR